MRMQRSIAVVLLAGVAACSESPAEPVADVQLASVAASGGQLGRVTGGGHYTIDLGGGLVLDAKFAMSGRQTGPDGSATGNFHHGTELFEDGIDFRGTLTCLAIDPVEGRAWIGGVITQNRSVREPFASGEIYQTGKDLWFRVLDGGEPSEGVDRTTFVGFEGGGGIATSQQYCDERIWPDGDARTNPLSAGNLKVKP